MSLRAWWALFLQELKKIFSYRVNFWMQFVGATGGEILIAYLLWGAIFHQTGMERIGGLTYAEMVRYYLLSALLSRVIRGAENFQISQEVYDGSLTRFLIYPGHYFSYKLSERAAYFLMNVFQLFVGIFIFWMIFRSEFEYFAYDNFLLAVLLTTYAALFNFVIMTTVELAAFWADNVWSLSVMMRFITSFFSGMMLPLSLYPDWLQKMLEYSPFPSMLYLPVQIALGHAGIYDFYKGLAILTAWLLPLFLFMLWVWNKGSRQYTGVGQ